MKTDTRPSNIYVPIIRDDVFYYLGQVGIGTPPKLVWLMIDMASGLIWTQYKPCINCFHQNYALFNTQAFSTYKKLPCNHFLCTCVYNFTYGESNRKGVVVSLESLVLKDMNGYASIMTRVIFGCSNDNHNFFLSLESLLNQMFEQINRRFSYCVGHLTEGLARPLYLRFAEDIPSHSGINRTPFVMGSGDTYYMLNLLDISIDTYHLRSPPGRPGGGPAACIANGFFIDSGAPKTIIDQTTNRGNACKGRRAGPKMGPSYELCYNDKPGFDQHPTTTFNFQDADYVVDGR
ncbi:hypothetical protein ACOSP7_030461 [Xanthoceras sorbifolium]